MRGITVKELVRRRFPEGDYGTYFNMIAVLTTATSALDLMRQLVQGAVDSCKEQGYVEVSPPKNRRFRS